MTMKGIDISAYQNNVNYDLVASQFEFAILRAGYGKVASQKDSLFEKHYSELKKRGVKLGAYWYSYAKDTNDALQEANTFLEIIKGKSFEMPLYYDVEENDQYKLGKERVSSIIKTFCDKVEQAGYFIGYYTNLSWYQNVVNDEVKKRFALWIAHWNVSQPGVNGGIWQYSVKKVDGIGECDCDLCYVDYPEIIKQKGLNGFAKQTEDKHEELFNNNKEIEVSVSIAGETYSGKLQKK